MLRFLSVQNLAVIESLEVEFDPGLNVLTGETGAGKSILVEAVGLLMGERASPDLVRTGADSTIVQAVFDRSTGEELIVRREVTSQGRSRAFVNGALVTAAALRELGSRLVDLHGQHEHQALLDPEAHLDVLDQFAGLSELGRSTEAAFVAMREARERLETLRREARERGARAELLQFQLEEIKRAAPRSSEDEELGNLRRVLASAERIRRLCDESYALLYESDQAVLASLSQVWKRVGELAALEPKFGGFLDARDGIKSQLDELSRSLRDYGAGIDASPARLQQIEDRLALLERLKRKYGPTLEDVLAQRRSCEEGLKTLETLDEQVGVLEGALASATAVYLDAARALSVERHRAAPRFSASLERQLGRLAMARTKVEVRFTGGERAVEEGTARGLDEAEFYVSPNPGEELRPLARIVSGGELSRLMLALKTLASTDRPGKTLIFDEVDAGIGGHVAMVVGGRLRALGDRFQVLCITHLPQIAAYGSAHFAITKDVRANRTITSIERLSQQERTGELARMIGGSTMSPGAMASAREMLNACGSESEQKPKGESERPTAKAATAKAKR
jgi:DNA repair protein RecN (Recombination protein N)